GRRRAPPAQRRGDRQRVREVPPPPRSPLTSLAGRGRALGRATAPGWVTSRTARSRSSGRVTLRTAGWIPLRTAECVPSRSRVGHSRTAGHVAYGVLGG